MRRHADTTSVNTQRCRHDVLMPRSNAGIKRNRRPAGELTKSLQVRVAEHTLEEIRAAAKASGNISYSLYLERIVAMLADERGALPVFVDSEETHTAAA